MTAAALFLLGFLLGVAASATQQPRTRRADRRGAHVEPLPAHRGTAADVMHRVKEPRE